MSGRLIIGDGDYGVGEVALDEMERARQNAMRQAQLRASLLAQQQDYSLNQQKLALSQRSSRDDQRARMMQLGLQSRQQGIDNEFRAGESVFNRGFKEKAFGADREDALFGRGERERDFGLREKDSIGRAEDRDADRDARKEAALAAQRQAQMGLLSREETGALAPLYRDLEDAKQAGDFNTAQKIQRDIEMLKGQFTERIRGTMGLPPSSNPAAPSEPVSQKQRTPEEYAEMARVMGMMANPAMRNSLEATGGGGGSAGTGESIPNESNAARIARFRAEKESLAKAAAIAEQDRVRKEATDVRVKDQSYRRALSMAEEEYTEAKKLGLNDEAAAMRSRMMSIDDAATRGAPIPPESDEVAAARSSMRAAFSGERAEKIEDKKTLDKLNQQAKSASIVKSEEANVRRIGSAAEAEAYVRSLGLKPEDKRALLMTHPTFSEIQNKREEAKMDPRGEFESIRAELLALKDPTVQQKLLKDKVNVPEYEKYLRESLNEARAQRDRSALLKGVDSREAEYQSAQADNEAQRKTRAGNTAFAGMALGPLGLPLQAAGYMGLMSGGPNKEYNDSFQRQRNRLLALREE